MDRDRLLERLAVVSVLVAAVLDVKQDLEGRSLHPAPILVAILVAAGAIAVLRRWTPEGWAAIRGAPRLLVPLGIRTGIHYPLAWLAFFPGINEGPVLLGFRISVFVALSFAVEGFLAAWQTILVLRAAAGAPVSPWGELREAWRLFPRAVGLCFTCWALLLLPFAAIVTIVLIVPWTLFWNFFTAAVLVWGLDPRRRFGEALGHGTILSWSLRRAWWKPLLAQMVLLGGVTVVAISARSGPTTTSSSSFGASAFWTGGYEASSRWIDAWTKVPGANGSALLALASALALGALAVGIKVVIAKAVGRPTPGQIDEPIAVGSPRP